MPLKGLSERKFSLIVSASTDPVSNRYIYKKLLVILVVFGWVFHKGSTKYSIGSVLKFLGFLYAQSLPMRISWNNPTNLLNGLRKTVLKYHLNGLHRRFIVITVWQ